MRSQIIIIVRPISQKKNEISFCIPSDQSGTLASLDSYIKDESIRPERSFICPYCSKFSSP
jgi:hypothetical protein